jgi:ATP-binding cassette subfamily G (WHITE) protein 1/ATP-binding cassette subfamily G (WHITE) protein 2
MSGFVWQDALYHSHMTPREALEFAARVKLPSGLSKAEREERVDSLLHAFDLDKCQNTKIGGDAIKGISGGEKKRLSIAIGNFLF